MSFLNLLHGIRDIRSALNSCLFSPKPIEGPDSRRTASLFVLLSVLLFGLSGCGGSAQTSGQELVVGAASSLTKPLDEISALYNAQKGVVLKISYASSGTLRKQLEEGAPFDLVFLASSKDMNTLSESGQLLDHTIRDLLSNQICYVSKSAVTLETLPVNMTQAERITLGDPSSVPVGQYAMESLVALGLNGLIEGKQLFAKDARQVVQYLNSGAVDAGFVFSTDAGLLEGDFFVVMLPAESHRPILYPAAVSASSPQAEAAADFLDFLGSPEASAIFESYGFSLPQ
ncbi:molybdate ABC transporter substrate-binding protein [Acidaminobacter hydrogenoformans]|uniref:Molybdate transport system substrate-binding protein n=1 Tax=Acidaminobacter hydrogenoformans DSM 2784 TaxID=1120920 RepID=A0A1G5RTF5_9FIRM|nr:molybdate ABC transporter substrate-binding protein [Acidaminobacter hydrogenoformans]SCZ77276.1 molybdate transport system substrate-binding protein [Acidaminobacter hydrogenoformans DSM 2784]